MFFTFRFHQRSYKPVGFYPCLISFFFPSCIRVFTCACWFLHAYPSLRCSFVTTKIKMNYNYNCKQNYKNETFFLKSILILNCLSVKKKTHPKSLFRQRHCRSEKVSKCMEMRQMKWHHNSSLFPHFNTPYSDPSGLIHFLEVFLYADLF